MEPSPSGQWRAATTWRDVLSLPLEGLLVADFSRVLAGPLAATTLADLGATVIKVERPGVGDETRQWGPPWTDNSSSYFDSANRSKKSVELDLSDLVFDEVPVAIHDRSDPAGADRPGFGRTIAMPDFAEYNVVARDRRSLGWRPET